MRLYRVRHYTEGGTCGGFAWFQSMRLAREHAERYDREMRGDDDPNCEIEEFHIGGTKAEVLAHLNKVASEPQNG